MFNMGYLIVQATVLAIILVVIWYFICKKLGDDLWM